MCVCVRANLLFSIRLLVSIVFCHVRLNCCEPIILQCIFVTFFFFIPVALSNCWPLLFDCVQSFCHRCNFQSAKKSVALKLKPKIIACHWYDCRAIWFILLFHLFVTPFQITDAVRLFFCASAFCPFSFAPPTFNFVNCKKSLCEKDYSFSFSSSTYRDEMRSTKKKQNTDVPLAWCNWMCALFLYSSVLYSVWLAVFYASGKMKDYTKAIRALHPTWSFKHKKNHYI